MRRERTAKPRKMLPLFLVFCEGDTEEAYINFLRQNYRIPIKIIPKKIGSEISQKLINRYKKELTGKSESIQIFLLYDGDVNSVVENLRNCDGILLLSKPCIEIWFLAHLIKISETEISSDNCIKCLMKQPGFENYKKAYFSQKQELLLWENRELAVECMKAKVSTSSTYSSVYKLIEILEVEKNKRDCSIK